MIYAQGIAGYASILATIGGGILDAYKSLQNFILHGIFFW